MTTCVIFPRDPPNLHCPLMVISVIGAHSTTCRLLTWLGLVSPLYRMKLFFWLFFFDATTTSSSTPRKPSIAVRYGFVISLSVTSYNEGICDTGQFACVPRQKGLLVTNKSQSLYRREALYFGQTRSIELCKKSSWINSDHYGVEVTRPLPGVCPHYYIRALWMTLWWRSHWCVRRIRGHHHITSPSVTIETIHLKVLIR